MEATQNIVFVERQEEIKEKTIKINTSSEIKAENEEMAETEILGNEEILREENKAQIDAKKSETLGENSPEIEEIERNSESESENGIEEISEFDDNKVNIFQDINPRTLQHALEELTREMQRIVDMDIFQSNTESEENEEKLENAQNAKLLKENAEKIGKISRQISEEITAEGTIPTLDPENYENARGKCTVMSETEFLEDEFRKINARLDMETKGFFTNIENVDLDEEMPERALENAENRENGDENAASSEYGERHGNKTRKNEENLTEQNDVSLDPFGYLKAMEDLHQPETFSPEMDGNLFEDTSDSSSEDEENSEGNGMFYERLDASEDLDTENVGYNIGDVVGKATGVAKEEIEDDSFRELMKWNLNPSTENTMILRPIQRGRSDAELEEPEWYSEDYHFVDESHKNEEKAFRESMQKDSEKYRSYIKECDRKICAMNPENSLQLSRNVTVYDNTILESEDEFSGDGEEKAQNSRLINEKIRSLRSDMKKFKDNLDEFTQKHRRLFNEFTNDFLVCNNEEEPAQSNDPFDNLSEEEMGEYIKEMVKHRQEMRDVKPCDNRTEIETQTSPRNDLSGLSTFEAMDVLAKRCLSGEKRDEIKGGLNIHNERYFTKAMLNNLEGKDYEIENDVMKNLLQTTIYANRQQEETFEEESDDLEVMESEESCVKDVINEEKDVGDEKTDVEVKENVFDLPIIKRSVTCSLEMQLAKEGE